MLFSTTGRSCSSLQSFGLLLFRLVVGAAFILHGLDKIAAPFTWFGAESDVPGIMQAFAAYAEFLGGIGVLLGAFTPLASLGIAATMVGALFLVHFPAGHAFVSKSSSFELPLTYLVGGLLLLTTGPGAYSVDAIILNKQVGSVTTA